MKKWKKESSAQCRLAGNTAYELYINYLSARYVSALRCSLGVRVGVGPFHSCWRLLPAGSAWLALCASLSLSLSLLSISFTVSQSVCLFVALQCICLASVSRDWGHSFVLIPCKLWDWQRGQRVDSSEALHINRVLKMLWNRNVIGKGSIRLRNTDYILFNHGLQASSALAWYLPANQ